jgi:hypothetical protein
VIFWELRLSKWNGGEHMKLIAISIAAFTLSISFATFEATAKGTYVSSCGSGSSHNSAHWTFPTAPPGD